MPAQVRCAVKPRAVSLALACMVAFAGCSSDKGFETRDVESGDFGADWPFVADSGVLACEPGDVPTFTAKGITVGLDDPDMSRRQWDDDATAEQAARMRDEALTLCD